jgi:hypothetical protein
MGFTPSALQKMPGNGNPCRGGGPIHICELISTILPAVEPLLNDFERRGVSVLMTAAAREWLTREDLLEPVTKGSGGSRQDYSFK